MNTVTRNTPIRLHNTLQIHAAHLFIIHTDLNVPTYFTVSILQNRDLIKLQNVMLDFCN